MKINERKSGDVTTLEIKGELEPGDYKQLGKKIQDLILRDVRKIVLELSGVNLDLPMIFAIDKAREELERGENLKIAGLDEVSQAAVNRILLAGNKKPLSYFSTVKSAIESF